MCVDRVNEFKDQCLTTVSGNLRCDACRETLSKKKEFCQETRIIHKAHQSAGEYLEKQEERSKYQGSSCKNKRRSKRIHIT